MNDSLALPIARFTRDVLSHEGALVEASDEGTLDVVAGRELRERLDLADYQRFAFSPDVNVAGATVVDYDSPVVERMGQLVDRLAASRSSRDRPPP